jgi:predicted ribosome quality control (RQC) complex YloA/Tae2 family protein
MKVKLIVGKSLEENAGVYYDKAKKLRKKINGANEALNKHYSKLTELEEKQEKIEVKEQKQLLTKQRKKEWYEKFRWFFSSEGFLCVGGRDATTNEIVIKKHTDKDDIVFHTDMAGSPFFVVKSEGSQIGVDTLQEVANATASFSKAWQKGLSTLDVFYVKPEQVSKEAQSGEYLAKGSFMIRGKTSYLNPDIKLAVGVQNGRIISGPVDAIKKHAEIFCVVVQGNDKISDVAKKLQKKLNAGTLDEIIAMLPAGKSRVLK